MWYMMIGEDRAGTLEKRLAARPAHVERFRALNAEGRVLLVGPCPAIDSADPGPAGFWGSLMIAEFPSLAEAEAFAQADPYVAAGVWEKVTVKPFRKVLPD
jgi:uncharacterized protein YciI